MATATLRTIFINERGIAFIAGTSIKVKEIVVEKTVWGMTPEEMLAAHPHWSLPQIYAALSYYYDHQAEIDAQIEADRAWAATAREASPNPLSREDFLHRLHLT
jgi:uncharacterized protein (DUF433 family)